MVSLLHLHVDNILSCWFVAIMNIDLFTLPHKALRALVGQTATRLGALDVANAREVEHMQNELHGVVDELQSHGVHEDEFILPLLERHLPDLATRMRAEHAEVGGGLADARRGISAFGAEPRVARQLALYRQLRRFEGLNLRHLDFEETIVMPALWHTAPAEELAHLMAAFRAAHPEAGDLYRHAPEALTVSERTMVGV
jgi:iron-sulfur cluster repair protein YtfE (RIC family)